MSGATFVQLTVSIVAAIGIGDTVFFESTRAIGLSRAMTIATTYPVGAALLAAAFLGRAAHGSGHRRHAADAGRRRR